MDDAAQRLVEDALSDAVVDPGAWTRALDLVSSKAQARGAAFLPIRGRLPGLPMSTSMREAGDTYLEGGWANRDGRDRVVPTMLERGIAADHEHISPQEMDRHPFWAEFLAPLGLRWFCGLIVHARDDLWCLAIQRGPGEAPFATAEQAALLRLSRPLSRAATLVRQLSEARLGGMSDALDHVGRAALILDRRGRVVRVNEGAAALIGDALDLRDGVLVARGQPRVSLALRGHCEAAARRDVPPGSPQLLGVAVPRPAARPLLVQAHPVRGDTSACFAFGEALVLITDPDARGPPLGPVLKTLFGLSPSEARLVQALATETGLPGAARKAGLSYETARSYLKSIFEKTETRDQRELMILLTRLAGR